MKQETIDVVRSILAADETVSKDKLESVLRNLRQTAAPHRHLIGAKQAMQIFGNIFKTNASFLCEAGIHQSNQFFIAESEIRRRRGPPICRQRRFVNDIPSLAIIDRNNRFPDGNSNRRNGIRFLTAPRHPTTRFRSTPRPEAGCNTTFCDLLLKFFLKKILSSVFRFSLSFRDFSRISW